MRSSVADSCGRQGGRFPCDRFGASLPTLNATLQGVVALPLLGRSRACTRLYLPLQSLPHPPGQPSACGSQGIVPQSLSQMASSCRMQGPLCPRLTPVGIDARFGSVVSYLLQIPRSDSYGMDVLGNHHW